MAASRPIGAQVEAEGSAAVHTRLQLVSANYFDVLGVAPRQGRGFLPEDSRPSSTPVVVLSLAFAQRLASTGPILGRRIKLNGTVFTIVGIAPDAFTGSGQDSVVPDAWAPAATLMRDPGQATFQIIGRLGPAIRAATARAETDLLIRQTATTPRDDDPTIDVTLQHPSFLDNTEDPRFQALVAGLMLLVGAVLLVACANLANLMLARGASRQKEIGVRLALGASRGRLVRQLLTESVTLGLGGGIVGLALALWSSRMLGVWAEGTLFGHFAGDLRLSLDLAPDLRVFGYAVGTSLLAGILFGLLPALRCTRPDLNTAIKDGGAAFGARLSRSRLRGLLIAGQVAVSVTLLITAGLLTRGLARARTADPGFDARTLLILNADYGADPATRQHRLLNRLAALPEVVRVAEGQAPLSGTWTPPIVTDDIRGRTLASRGNEEYLATLGLPLLRGRAFTRREAETNAPVAVISEGAAHRFWPSGNPIGRRFQLDMDFRGHMAQFEVVGIVKDARLANLSRIDPAHVYVTLRPADQEAALIRVQGDPARAIDSIRRAVRDADPELLPSLNVTSIADGPLWLQQTQAGAMAAGASFWPASRSCWPPRGFME